MKTNKIIKLCMCKNKKKEEKKKKIVTESWSEW